MQSTFSHRGSVYDSVEVCWFVVYRDNSALSNGQLTNGYPTNSANPRYISEENLYELFTEKEASTLKEYLLRICKVECEIKEANLITEANTLGHGDRTPGHGGGFYRLDQGDSYDLPFVVWGYYDISYAKDVSWLIYGVESIERVLDKFGMNVTDINKLKATIEELNKQGLFIEKH